jgi:hypothetical protein
MIDSQATQAEASSPHTATTAQFEEELREEELREQTVP